MLGVNSVVGFSSSCLIFYSEKIFQGTKNKSKISIFKNSVRKITHTLARMTVLGLKNSQIAIERNHVISFVEIPVLGKQINSYK